MDLFDSNKTMLLVGVLIFVVVFVVAGFSAGSVADGMELCTVMACSCPTVEEAEEEGRGEVIDGDTVVISCNSCTKTDPVFYTHIFNIVETCSGTEYITCEEEEQVDWSVEYEDGCDLEPKIFSIL